MDLKIKVCVRIQINYSELIIFQNASDITNQLISRYDKKKS
jgi:hypothetical protein